MPVPSSSVAEPRPALPSRRQGVPRGRRVRVLADMLRSREVDRRAGLALRQGMTWFHVSSAGHEALGVLAELLRDDDLVLPHYRDRALVQARGLDVRGQARDLLGTAGSHSAGRAMSSHFSHRPGNVFSLASPTGSQCLPAVGAAWSTRLRGEGDALVVCSMGEAGTRQGEFFEALAFALERRLPVVFLVADNGYGISTPTARLSPRALGLLPAEATRTVAGWDPDAVHAAAVDTLPAVRAGEGPIVLWCELDRLDSHTSSDDQRVYRPRAELDALRDPIACFEQRLLDEGLIDDNWARDTRERLAAEVEEVFDDVARESAAAPDSVLDHVFAASGPAVGPRTRPRGGTMVRAVNDALRAGLEQHPELVLFGQDVEDPKGGVFGLTRGLGALAGPRLTNAPLAEATIVGAGVGLAATGLRPVVELQFVDFAAPAWNQLSAQVATVRWRTASAWTCPLVIYAPWGGYLPGGGIWHSQSNESLFTHLPGLRVVIPSTPEDAEGVFLESFRAADPTLILLPKHLLRRTVPPAAGATPVHGAVVTRPGSDVTVVTWGNGTELALTAATELAEEGVEIEVLDLRWLVPLDRDAVSRSLARTGRLVVVQEDNRTSSFGAGLIAELVGRDEDFYRLHAAPRLVTRDDVHIPFHPDLEAAVLPTIGDVVAAVRSVLA